MGGLLGEHLVNTSMVNVDRINLEPEITPVSSFNSIVNNMNCELLFINNVF